MAARHFNVTLAAAAVRLSDAYGGAAGADPDAALDIPYRQLLLSSAGAAAFVGSDADVSSTDYGVRVELGAAGDHPVSIGPFETGPIKLSQLWAAGAGATLHILGIPF